MSHRRFSTEIFIVVGVVLVPLFLGLLALALTVAPGAINGVVGFGFTTVMFSLFGFASRIMGD